MGEGGALLICSPEDNLRSEIIWEKGTNRSEFLLGMVDKYSWVALGSSNLPSELSASYLYGQLRSAQEIHDRRMARYQQYYDLLKPLEEAGKWNFRLSRSIAVTMHICFTSKHGALRSVQS